MNPSSPLLLRLLFLAVAVCSERRIADREEVFVQDAHIVISLGLDFFLGIALISVRHLCCLTVVCNGPCETWYYSQPLCITVTQMTNIDISL